MKRSAVLNKVPVASGLEFGELLVNYNGASAALYTKGSDGAMRQLGGVYINNSAPANPVEGQWWWDADDQILYLRNAAAWLTVSEPFDITQASIGDLSDVDLTGISNDDLLAWNGTQFVPVTPASISVDVDLGYTAAPGNGSVTNTAGDDATIPARTNTNAGLMLPADKAAIDGLPADFDFLRSGDNVSELNNDAGYITAADLPDKTSDLTNDGEGTGNPFATTDQLFSGDYGDLTGAPTIPGALNDLSDVTVPAPSNGDILSYNGAAWVNASAPPADISGSNIGQLNDVDTTGATNGQILEYNGTTWVATDNDHFSGDYNDLSNKPAIPTKTSDLTNDGADGVNPFITANDIPAGNPGTVTSIGAGDGLATDGANPITGAGTLRAVAANATITVTAGGIAVTPGQYFPAAGGELDGVITTPEKTITSLAFDLSQGPFWTCGSIDVPNPTNAVAGMSGLIRFSGPPTSWGFNFKFVGGTSVAPSDLPAVSPFYVKAPDEIYVGPAVENLI